MRDHVRNGITKDGRVDHDLTNQTPPMNAANAWRADPLLNQLADSFSQQVKTELETLARYARSPEAQDLARLANAESPVLRTHDRHGRRADIIEFHPSYHALMRRSIGVGIHSSIWEDSPAEKGKRHQARAARFYLLSQLELGHLCPLTMTSASLAALMSTPQLFREWAPRIVARKYDHTNKPVAQKQGVTIGMGLTEKQGGTDLRANTTTAEQVGRGVFRLTGHKWFLSAPMSDAFLVVAQAKEGLSCFFAPRLREDGTPNGFHFQRLKDKLGNRSNATAEVEFVDTLAWPVGELGHGIRTIMDMVTLTRLDCALGSAGLMRAALAEAVHHARHRAVQGVKLIDQPLMIRVLADLALDVAAATALSFRLARSFDEAANTRADAAFARVMTPVVKYWTTKIAPAITYEAMECLGGNGYVEDFPMARVYREAPVNAIWEGSGNVMALDVVRVLTRNPSLLDDVLAVIHDDLGEAGPGTVKVLSAAIELCKSDEAAARFLTEQLALAAAAAELRRLGTGRIADAFIETRLAGQWRTTYGMLDMRHDARRIIDVLYPAV